MQHFNFLAAQDVRAAALGHEVSSAAAANAPRGVGAAVRVPVVQGSRTTHWVVTIDLSLYLPKYGRRLTHASTCTAPLGALSPSVAPSSCPCPASGSMLAPSQERQAPRCTTRCSWTATLAAAAHSKSARTGIKLLRFITAARQRRQFTHAWRLQGASLGTLQCSLALMTQSPCSATAWLPFCRWVSAYRKPGRWVTDISPFLGLFTSPPNFHRGNVTLDYYAHNLYFTVSVLPCHVPRVLRVSHAPICAQHLDLVFAQQGKAELPTQAVKKLWEGGTFDLGYNAARPPINFTAPHDTGTVSRVEVVGLITGHGWGRDKQDCAEFCVTQVLGGQVPVDATVSP